MVKILDDYTNGLTDHERTIIAPMIMAKLICHKGSLNAIKNRELIAYCHTRGELISEPRIRKIVEYIRQRNLLDGLVAKKVGYFIAENPKEIGEWIATMKQRRNAINRSIQSAVRTLARSKQKLRSNSKHCN